MFWVPSTLSLARLDKVISFASDRARLQVHIILIALLRHRCQCTAWEYRCSPRRAPLVLPQSSTPSPTTKVSWIRQQQEGKVFASILVVAVLVVCNDLAPLPLPVFCFEYNYTAK